MSRHTRLDRVCAEAVDTARAAAEETGEGVGEHLSVIPEGERVATHFFDCQLRGYRGWRWAVVVARAPRSRTVTVSETALLPGPDALTAPEWVPWANRLRAGDVGAGDLLPTEEQDPRLEPAYVYSDDDGLEDLAFALGVGRERVMSREGRAECADRWYAGDAGPHAEIATSAPKDARCGTCGFYLQLAGSLRQLFGVCGNFYAADDGKVVSADHGCGAHSQVLSGDPQVGATDIKHSDTIYDDAAVVDIDTSGRASKSIETVVAAAAEMNQSGALNVEPTQESSEPEESAPETDSAVESSPESEAAEEPVASEEPASENESVGEPASETDGVAEPAASEEPASETDTVEESAALPENPAEADAGQEPASDKTAPSEDDAAQPADGVTPAGEGSLLTPPLSLPVFVAQHEQCSGDSQRRAGPGTAHPPTTSGGFQVGRVVGHDAGGDQPNSRAAQRQRRQRHLSRWRRGTKRIQRHGGNLALSMRERRRRAVGGVPVHTGRARDWCPQCDISCRIGCRSRYGVDLAARHTVKLADQGDICDLVLSDATRSEGLPVRWSVLSDHVAACRDAISPERVTIVASDSRE